MRLKTCVKILLMSLALAAPSHAGARRAEVPEKYRLELVRIVGSEPREFVFVLNGAIGFKTVEALRDFIGRMRPDSIIEWAPGCLRAGDEPLLSSEEELEEFARFCRERGVNFVLIPSG